MLGLSEPLTSRRITRLRFLEQESEQLRIYKIDLDFCLLNTKRLLSEILSAQVIPHRQIDSSADTEFVTHAPLRSLEISLEKNMALLAAFKKVKNQRDLMLGKVLISEQLAEETIRKEHEIIQESEDHCGDVRYVLDKKDTRISNLKMKIDVAEAQLSRLKNESIVVVGLSEDNLNLYKQTEKIKGSLSRASKMLQINELQTEELASHYLGLAIQLDQCRVFVRNPMVRNKKTINLGATQALDMTLDLNLDESSSSSSEVCFPDKLQIESKVKPSLPRLDFTKVVKLTNGNSNNKNAEKPTQFMQMKSKVEYLERQCMEKTELLNQIRQQIKVQQEKNANLLNKFYVKKQVEGMNNIIQKPKRKRALSNTLDYLTQEVDEIPKVLATEESPVSSRESSEINFANISSFYGSEVAKLEFQEPDSILAEYIHEINND